MAADLWLAAPSGPQRPRRGRASWREESTAKRAPRPVCRHQGSPALAEVLVVVLRRRWHSNEGCKGSVQAENPGHLSLRKNHRHNIPASQGAEGSLLAEGEQEDRYFGVLGFKSALLSTASYCLTPRPCSAIGECHGGAQFRFHQDLIAAAQIETLTGEFGCALPMKFWSRCR
jgi:hypothetical protein